MRELEEIVYRDWVSDACDLLVKDILEKRENKRTWQATDDE